MLTGLTKMFNIWIFYQPYESCLASLIWENIRAFSLLPNLLLWETTRDINAKHPETKCHWSIWLRIICNNLQHWRALLWLLPALLTSVTTKLWSHTFDCCFIRETWIWARLSCLTHWRQIPASYSSDSRQARECNWIRMRYQICLYSNVE